MALSRGGNVKVTIYDTQIQGHFRSGGIVWDEVGEVGRRAVKLAKIQAPKRTGRMARSIGGGNPINSGIYGTSSTVYATIGYAIFVEEGTHGPITPKRGNWLKVPSRKGRTGPNDRRLVGKTKGNLGGLIVFKREVAGQKARHFLRNGMNNALLSKGYPALIG